MTDRTISLRQMMTVLALILFPLGTEVLFLYLAPAGSAAWLCLAGAGVVVVLLAALVGKTRGLGDPLALWRPRTARVWAGIFLAWGLILCAAQAARVGARLTDSLGGSPVLLTAAALALGAWMAHGGLPAFARACEIFGLAVGGGFVFLCLFGVFRLEWHYIILWEAGELAQVPQGVLSAVGVLAVGCYALLLTDHINRKEETGSRGRVCRWLGGIFLLLAAAVVLVLGRFGPALMGQLRRPFFQAASGLGFEGAFQRLEELVSALWFLGDAALLGFLLLVLAGLWGRIRGKEPERGVWWMALPAFLLALPGELWSRVERGGILPLGTLVIGGLILVFSARKGTLEKTSKKFEKRG